MAEQTTESDNDSTAGELRGQLVKRLAVAGVLVAILLGVLAIAGFLLSLMPTRLRAWRRQLGYLVLALGLLAGLSYISGAIAAVVLGACWLVLGWVLHSRAAPALAAMTLATEIGARRYESITAAILAMSRLAAGGAGVGLGQPECRVRAIFLDRGPSMGGTGNQL